LAAIEVAKRLADGRATQEEASLAEAAARQAYEEVFEKWLNSDESGPLVIQTPERSASSAMLLLDRQAGNFGGAGLCHFPVDRDAPDYRNYRKRGQWQADVLRCLFGNLFRHVSVESDWRTPTVTNLAAAAYDNRRLPAKLLDPELLAILADALEEAGCTNEEILAHCRGPGPHVLGCWVVDLLLARE
jgi:hypothetical protein